MRSAGTPSIPARSSSVPASPGSAWRLPCSAKVSTSSSWRRPTTSAAPGATTPTPAAPAISRPTCTPSRSSRTRTGGTCGRSQPEIFDYLKGVTEKYGLRRYVRFSCSRRARALGRRRAPLARVHRHRPGVRRAVPRFRRRARPHIPPIPDIEGIATFAGAAFHSAHWDHALDLTGKRVAVIGTGASAIQFVPEIVADVAD